MDVWKTKIKEKLTEFFRELKETAGNCGRESDQIEVLFATKYLTNEQLVSFIEFHNQLYGGKLLIGENRVQDAEDKFRYLENFKGSPCRIARAALVKVMIGNLQRNKINKALSLFDEIWGIDTIELAEAIDSRVKSGQFPVFLEVNISGEKAKHGIIPDQLDEVIRSLKSLRILKLKGLMTMAPESKNRETIKAVFRELKQLAVRHNLLTSMGMSGDWKEAVAEGSDILRIGSRIFTD